MSALSLKHQTAVPSVGLETPEPVRSKWIVLADVAGDDGVNASNVDVFMLVRPAAAVLVMETAGGECFSVWAKLVDIPVMDDLVNRAGRSAGSRHNTSSCAGEPPTRGRLVTVTGPCPSGRLDERVRRSRAPQQGSVYQKGRHRGTSSLYRYRCDIYALTD